MPEAFVENPGPEIERKTLAAKVKERTVDLTVQNIAAFVEWARAHKIKFVLLLAFAAWNATLIIANLDGLIHLFDQLGTLIGKATGIGGN